MFSVFYFPLLGTPTAEGNELTFYEAGLDVPLAVYTDSEGLVAWSQPIVLNAAGEADGVIYVDPDGPALKVVYEDADGVAIAGYPVDFVSPSTIVNVMTTSITTLTNAQIKALPTTPITLITAPASGLRVKLLGVTLSTHFSAGAYTNVDADGSDLVVLGANGDWLTTPLVNDTSDSITLLTDFFHAANTVTDLVPTAIYPTGGWNKYNDPPSPAANLNAAAVQIAMDNSGALTGGNAANTLTVTVYYALESLA